MSPFAAHRISRNGSFRVAAVPSVAFQLFTPLGEKKWVEGWHPRLVHPPSGQLEEGQVFTTGQGAEHTIWTVLRVDHGRFAVDYLRVTPGSRVGWVTVRAGDNRDGSSTVHVRYTFTGLSEAGNALIEKFAAGYAAMMRDWEEAVNRYLRGDRGERP